MEFIARSLKIILNYKNKYFFQVKLQIQMQIATIDGQDKLKKEKKKLFHKSPSQFDRLLKF